jgi:hypothetical protein
MTGEHRTAVGGFQALNMPGHGRLLSVDDLVTDVQERAKGAGGVFFERLVDYARAHGCASIHLDSLTAASGMPKRTVSTCESARWSGRFTASCRCQPIHLLQT